MINKALEPGNGTELPQPDKDTCEVPVANCTQ